MSKPLLTEYLGLVTQLDSLGFDIEPTPEDEPGYCSFHITNRRLGSVLHLPNIEQVQGMVACYLCFRVDKQSSTDYDKFRELTTGAQES